MTEYKGLFTFDTDNHRYVPVEQADGLISDMNYMSELEEKPKPKKYFWISPLDCGVIEDDLRWNEDELDDNIDMFNAEIGNYFETEEEAEKAVEKLKAWKRLKDKGFRFQFWTSSYSGDSISFFIDWINADSKKEIENDLDLLFGGEE